MSNEPDKPQEKNGMDTTEAGFALALFAVLVYAAYLGHHPMIVVIPLAILFSVGFASFLGGLIDGFKDRK